MLEMRGGRAKARQRGDTIVEVLIACAVIGMVLVGAYAAVSRNTLINQDTQEHAQAQKLVESQIEFLRANGLSSGQTCFTSDGAATNGAACTTTDAQHYQLAIAAVSGGTYKVSATWTSLLSEHPTDSIIMFYRPQ